MIIKRTISFYPNKNKVKGDGNAPLRCYVLYNKITIIFNIGYCVNLDGWNSDMQRCKRNSTHDSMNIPAKDINEIISKVENVVNDCFKHFEDKNKMPSKEEFKDLLDAKTGKKKSVSDTDNFFSMFDKYAKSSLKADKWALNTWKITKNIRAVMHRFDPNLKVSDFDKPDITNNLMTYLLSCGYVNSSQKTMLRCLKTFLNWCISNRYIDNCCFTREKISIKTPKNVIIYLTWDELMSVYNHDFNHSKSLDRVRDVFCFCCFTSLRFSDVANLKASNITDDVIRITTIKTAKSIEIELNKYSKAILDKYKGMTFEKNRILPVTDITYSNKKLKIIAKACGIDSPITIATYRGNRRVEETYKKYELVTTHVGRRTFISNAIMLGIPPEIVMKWSGHSSYSAMTPYIEIANEAKKQAMSMFDKI